MASSKTSVIEAIFNSRWDSVTRELSNRLVTLGEVSRSINDFNRSRTSGHLSNRNPANFFKDFIRKKRSANQNWPSSVWERGYTGRQVTGNNACFEFVPIPDGQAVPFPESVISAPASSRPRHRIESASLPLASRKLGRSDEPWLVQVLVRLRVIETHLALFSVRTIVQLDHLQMSVKLARTEIDALFLAVEQIGPGETREMIVCCEAKGIRDDILEDQVIRQIQAVFRMAGVSQNWVLPIAVKALRPSEIQVVEFEAVERMAAPALFALKIVSEAVYEFLPAIPGIGM